ncbi:MAG TPA: RNA methyltransferase [Ktedonobacterales bacterium]|nr:RNA methyltransferase [Ktedonobacterales bacterium]
MKTHVQHAQPLRHSSLDQSPLIDYLQHPALAWISRLRRRDVRERASLFYVEGVRFVAQAIEHHFSLKTLVVCRRLLEHPFAQRLVREQRRLGIPVLEVTPQVMHGLALVDDPQGIGAVVQQRWESLEQIAPGNELCWIALQTVRAPGNLGTILRTAEAVGCAGAILLGDATDPYDPATVRATMGALFTQRFVRATLADFERWKRQHQCYLIGTSPGAAADYHQIAYPTSTVLLMGEERKGLPPELQRLCDQLVRIPMVGKGDSLNLGIATGVMLYELFNQRRMAQGGS